MNWNWMFKESAKKDNNVEINTSENVSSTEQIVNKLPSFFWWKKQDCPKTGISVTAKWKVPRFLSLQNSVLNKQNWIS